MDARDLALLPGPGANAETIERLRMLAVAWEQYKKTEASQANQFIWTPGYAALVDNLHQPNYG